MKTIKLPEFSFKHEPMWMWLCSVVLAVVGVMIALFVVLMRKIVG
jgi:hypothetical protein